MQPPIASVEIDPRFRRSLGLCLLGIAALLFGVVSAFSPEFTVPLLFGFLGIVLVVAGAISMMGGS